ncbi:zinc metalloprotease [Anaerocolumna xylanovorans]|uniref:Peptidase family M50 n=1 Tax=Anaerocolumna xylanovorans DSM 12503 TaxID=1121345 RepID=A0A1M7XYV5_9FIRM|nr:hypothetical protein [Anaerocolumna xylanovorans]SHO44295.1 hypothetical protein SAMN02745217_00534 [Anaerocolumna xylanovorans DSM 12503]
MLSEQQKEKYKELEQEQQKIYGKILKKSKRITIISGLIGGVMGAFLGSWLVRYERQIEKELWGSSLSIFLLIIVAAMILSFLLHVILHEGGHLVFGLLTGYQFLSFRVGSLIWYKKDGKLHKGRYSVKGTLGQCLMYPPKKEADGGFPFILYNLGGGISNLLFSLLAVLLLMILHNGYLQAALMSFSFIGLITALSNLIPTRRVIQNDGMNAKSMLKDKYSREAFYLQLQLNAEMSEGKGFTEYSEEVFEIPEGAKEDDMLVAGVRLLSYYRYLALHDFKSAKEILERMDEKKEKYSQMFLHAIEQEKFFLMILEKRPTEEIASLYKYLRKVMQANKNNISTKRIIYAYEVLLGDEEKKDIDSLTLKEPGKWVKKDKEELYREFIKEAEKYPVKGEAKFYIDMVDYINETMAYVI